MNNWAQGMSGNAQTMRDSDGALDRMRGESRIAREAGGFGRRTGCGVNENIHSAVRGHSGNAEVKVS